MPESLSFPELLCFCWHFAFLFCSVLRFRIFEGTIFCRSAESFEAWLEELSFEEWISGFQRTLKNCCMGGPWEIPWSHFVNLSLPSLPSWINPSGPDQVPATTMQNHIRMPTPDSTFLEGTENSQLESDVTQQVCNHPHCTNSARETNNSPPPCLMNPLAQQTGGVCLDLLHNAHPNPNEHWNENHNGANGTFIGMGRMCICRILRLPIRISNWPSQNTWNPQNCTKLWSVHFLWSVNREPNLPSQKKSTWGGSPLTGKKCHYWPS